MESPGDDKTVEITEEEVPAELNRNHGKRKKHELQVDNMITAASLKISPSNEIAGISDELLVENKDASRIITFNRPHVKNALTTEMVYRTLRLLEEWEDDNCVELVILKGNGNNFSSGGDLRWFYNLTKAESSWKELVFRKYWLDYYVHSYQKPIIAIAHGIAMGGGAGLTLACKFKIVTEKTIFAMPEVAIGFHTDCGASYYLSRLPNCLGEYLCLTGAHLSGEEMLHCGLASHLVHSEDVVKLENCLLECRIGDTTSVQQILDKFSIPAKIHGDSILNSDNVTIVEKCFSKATVEEILVALEAETQKEASPSWILQTIVKLKRSSPTSLKATLQSIRRGQSKTLQECLFQEYCLTLHFLQGTISSDLYEGIRTKIIDKQSPPKWEPNCLSDVTDAKLDQIFTALDDVDKIDRLKRRKYGSPLDVRPEMPSKENGSQ